MSVSVIIPSYNRQKLLQRALTSVLEQTRPASEIIVVDDGSTDQTAEYLTECFPQVNFIQTNNLGVSHARNCGIKTATGEWIAFLDSDDEWRPNKLELQLKALAENSTYRICHCDETWVRDGKPLTQKSKHRKHGGCIFQHCLPLCAISPSTVLIHRDIFDVVGLFDEELPACEDYDLWLRITHRYPVLFVAETLITKYGGHPDQLSQKHWGMDRFRIKALEAILCDEFLSQQNRAAALDTLIGKLEVLILGARKRNNRAILEHYSDKLQYYKHLTNNHTAASV